MYPHSDHSTGNVKFPDISMTSAYSLWHSYHVAYPDHALSTDNANVIRIMTMTVPHCKCRCIFYTMDKVIWHKPALRRTRPLQSYSPGAINVHSHLVCPISIFIIPMTPPAELFSVYRPLDRRLLPSKLRIYVWASEPSSNTWFLGPTRVHISNGILIGSAIFAWLMVVTHRPTDWHADWQTTLLCPQHLAVSN